MDEDDADDEDQDDETEESEQESVSDTQSEMTDDGAASNTVPLHPYYAEEQTPEGQNLLYVLCSCG